jgi:hypothetical protein
MALLPGIFHRIYITDLDKYYRVMLTCEELEEIPMNTFVMVLQTPANMELAKNRIADPVEEYVFSINSHGYVYPEDPNGAQGEEEVGFLEHEGCTLVESGEIAVDAPERWVTCDSDGYPLLKVFFTVVDVSQGNPWHDKQCPNTAASEEHPGDQIIRKHIGAFAACFKLPHPENPDDHKMSKKKVKIIWKEDI